jgi:hypothetical protein
MIQEGSMGIMRIIVSL